jgi:hypothetical protein
MVSKSPSRERVSALEDCLPVLIAPAADRRGAATTHVCRLAKNEQALPCPLVKEIDARAVGTWPGAARHRADAFEDPPRIRPQRRLRAHRTRRSGGFLDGRLPASPATPTQMDVMALAMTLYGRNRALDASCNLPRRPARRSHRSNHRILDFCHHRHTPSARRTTASVWARSCRTVRLASLTVLIP